MTTAEHAGATQAETAEETHGVTLTDANAPNSQRFYRVRQW